ncbi:MAG: thiamine phosphate synthase [Bacteroidales bacterium]|nr:thiamine phosphate synthase [Bacteroidales bacterium]
MIQFISHSNERYSYLDGIRLALEGGCKWVQLRMKDAPDEQVAQLGVQARGLCDRYGAKLILDDRVNLVVQTGADGVHLGKNDMPIAQAREILGPGKIIGGTANTFEDIVAHWKSGADYIGCGPFRFTTTKKNLSPILGLEGYRDIVARMKDAGITLPLVAIGGITAEDIPAILETGVDGIAVSGTVLRAEDPAAEMAKLIELTKR